MAKAKRFWTREELIIAYYIAKWDYSGLNISEHDFANYVITDTTVASLRMQTACFRQLLGLDGHRLAHCSELMKELVKELENKTISQVRKLIFSYVDLQEDNIKILTIQKENKIVNKKRDQLNTQYQLDFDNKLKSLRRYRNLTPKVK